VFIHAACAYFESGASSRMQLVTATTAFDNRKCAGGYMIRLCVALLLALGITAAPASAQTRAEVYDRIEMLHGEADAFVVAFGILTEGFRDGVVDVIAHLGDYPFPVESNGELYDRPKAQAKSPKS
jgi:hypothetical protein